MTLQQPVAKRSSYFWHDCLVIVMSSLFCVTSQLKLFEIQYLELFYMLDLVLLAVWFLWQGNPLHVPRPLARIGMRWAIFSMIAILLAFWSLQQDFYVGQLTFFKRPFIVTLARIVELAVDVFYMLFLAMRLRQDLSTRKLAAWCYCMIGIASCLYAMFSLAINLAAGKTLLGGADPSARMIGFNNEGGSFGTYLLTVFFLILAMRSYRWLSLRASSAFCVVVFLTILGTRSKAAFFEVGLFCIIIPLLRMRGAKIVAAVSVSLIVLGVVYKTSNIGPQLEAYVHSAERYRILSLARPNDMNYVAGRVSGIFLAPKMIAAHPLAGIGLGNYPMVRDDPQYRQGSAIVGLSLDSPSLGPIDYIVDLGIPLFLYFTWVELAPTFTLARRGVPFPLVSLVLMQPVANWFGAHLNLTYPWVTAGIALGCVFAVTPNEPAQTPLPATLAL